MKHDLDSALDQCLVNLRGGMDVESCLAQYPEDAHDLRPLLQLVTQVGRVIIPASTSAARAAGQEQMLTALTRRHEREGTADRIVRAIKRMAVGLVPGRLWGPAPGWSLAAALLVVVLVVAGGVSVSASAKSLPGEALYPLKLASQRVQVALAFDDARQQGLEVRFETQKRLDVQAVLKGGQQTAVEFQGVLQSMERDIWVVGSLPVTLQDSTEIVGQPQLGALVQVRGSLPGNGNLLATWLHVKSDINQEPSQTPTATEAAVPSETPEPTGTPTPSDTPEPTETAEPAQTPTPRSTLEPTKAEEPGETPETSGGREPEATSEPVDTAEAEETPEPGGEAEPTEAPEPEDTPEPEREPEPTEAPESRGYPRARGRTGTDRSSRSRGYTQAQGNARAGQRSRARRDPGGWRARRGSFRGSRTGRDDGR